MTQIQIPAGFPPLRGETSFEAWFDRNYPRKEGETDLERLMRVFPKAVPGEPFLSWSIRLARHEVFCHALTTWPHPEASIRSITLRDNGSLSVEYSNHQELENFWKCFGVFMDERMKSAVRMRMVGPQYLVVSGRYGIGFMEKNVVHSALRFMGISSVFCVDTRGLSFHFSNSVKPTEEGAFTATNRDIYRSDSRKIWSLLITGSTNNAGNGVALLSHIFNKSSASPGDPEAGSKIKWQHSNAIVSAQVTSPGRMIIRGYISPEVFALCGLYPMASSEQLASAGFTCGIPRDLEPYPGVLKGQCENRKHGEWSTDARARNREIKQIYMTWEQLRPIMILLEMLEGFDESRIIKP